VLYKYVIIILIALFISSCGAKEKPKTLEGNIDVDSKIYIVPIGDIDVKFLNPLIPKLQTRFTTGVYLAPDKRIPLPEDAYDYDSQQYIAMYVLDYMSKKLKFPPDAKVLGVTNVDIFTPASDLVFLFGMAYKKANMALISNIRMDPRYYFGGKPNDQLVVQRMEKEAIHELGQLFGLDNSYDIGCVMFLPRNVKELDRKSDSFCAECQKKFLELKKSAEKIPLPGNLSK
jgi:archaemetzincin